METGLVEPVMAFVRLGRDGVSETAAMETGLVEPVMGAPWLLVRPPR